MATETLLNRGTERLTADELTMMVGDRDIKATGFWTHTKATESYAPNSVWLLVTMDDDEVLGEKPVVSAFASLDAARKAMFDDIQEEAAMGRLSIGDVDYSEEENFAHTKNGRFSWEVVETPVMKG